MGTPWKVSHFTYRHQKRYKSCTILSGTTAIPLLVDTPNIVVLAKLILFHMVWLIFCFHNTHQRRAPICVPAFTPPLVPLIVSPSKSLLLRLIQYPDRWHAKAMVHPTLCLALDSSLFHELIYLFDHGCICYNAKGIYCNSHHDNKSWSKKTWNTLVKIGFHDLMVIDWFPLLPGL